MYRLLVLKDQKMNTILVIDDEAVSRKVTSKYLSKFGFNVLEAINGKEATETFNDSVNLVIVDVNLPDISGVELAERLLEKREELAIIIISGNPANENVDHLLELPQVCFFQKPFKMASLVENVNALLR